MAPWIAVMESLGKFTLTELLNLMFLNDFHIKWTEFVTFSICIELI